jgi:hypothetical protein
MADAFDGMCLRCQTECSSPPRSICDQAVSYDSAKLHGDCLPWLETTECVHVSPDDFRAHCQVITFLDL